MIFVARTEKPAVLVRNEQKWTLAIRQAKTGAERKKAIDKYSHAEIKGALEEMFHGKCAYCESYISNVSYGDIEHFRPKGRFPTLAVKWENLLLACSKCNGAGQKGDEWPTGPEGGPLINPCEENPAEFFTFDFDPEIRVTIVRPLNDRGVTSERVYGLNKHTLLVDRNVFVRKLVCIAQYYRTDETAKQLLDEAVESRGEYSAFARAVRDNFVT